MFLAVIGLEEKAQGEDSLNDIVSDCGTCRRCIDRCETKAIKERKSFERKRCIRNYMLSNEIVPLEFRTAIKNRLLGCDDCQLVCPRNSMEIRKKIKIPADKNIRIKDLLESNKPEIKRCMNIIGDAVGNNYRRKNRILAGLTIIASNIFGREFSESFTELSKHENENIREYAQWALEREDKQ